MLTDTELKHLKPRATPYKVVDRDGMYVTVSPKGTITFRYDYRLNSRRETLTIGRYGPSGLSLARAREKCLDAKRTVSEGRSPSREKQREKRRLIEAQTFQEFTVKWLAEARMAESTRSMRKSIINRDILPVFKKAHDGNSSMTSHYATRSREGALPQPPHRDRGRFTVSRSRREGDQYVDDVGPSSIATFVPKDRAPRRPKSASCIR
jgi:hypothetical protein